ncbi:superinfection immunity protein [Gluconobacter sphaericus]|uniref:superinfection immunity protein n=1 Tax=Gluconobacter sphaericus TaxID=574987 RepID=UPI001B8D8574|nr:superinfection immunity protein [Gluconobacter sphaericus]MBS1098548.1 superinfection immunity protein [Gluconobacter sphaericus]
MFRELFLCAGMVAWTVGGAAAQSYSPDFDCSRANPADSIAVMLCQNSDAAKAELEFDQAYYALRQIVGKDGWKPLKKEAIADDEILKECIAPPDPSSPEVAPVADPACYIRNMNVLTEKYRGRLTGDASEEAVRPILTHRILQQKLIDLGYLPTGSIADGVYGESTRAAIETWQRVAKRPSADGFLSDDDATALLSQVPQNETSEDKTRPEISKEIISAQEEKTTPNFNSEKSLSNMVINSTHSQNYSNNKTKSMYFAIVITIVIVSILMYLLPTIIAINRCVNKMAAVVLVNILFGWTFIGWAVALIMACSMERSIDYDLRTRVMMQFMSK